MSSQFIHKSAFAKTALRMLLGLIAGILSCSQANARLASGAVGYSPGSANVEGVAPWTQSYVVTVTAPNDLGEPTTPAIVVRATGIPGATGAPGSWVGGVVSEATALSFVTVTPSAPVFTSPSQTIDFTITVNMPSLPATSDLLFTYELQVAGFDGNFSFNPSRSKTTINATATAVVAGGNPPVVTILTPAVAEVFTYAASALPTTIPLQFEASAQAGYPITAVEVRLNGNTVTPAPTLVFSGGDTFVSGTANLPILEAGTYTVAVRATNAPGIGSDSHTFTVNVLGPPPKIVINEPAPDTEFTYFVGGSPVVVPNHFTASTTLGSLRTWTASLTDPIGVVQNAPISPTNPSGASSVGSVQLSLSATGRYVLDASVTNAYGSASASTYFWINRVQNPVDRTVDAFQNATFSAVVLLRPDATYTYRWHRQAAGTTGFVALSDGGAYSGTTTLDLLVSGATVPMSGDRFKLVISKSGGGDIETMSALLTVNKLPLTVKADNQTKVYGTAIPTLTYTISGFASGQTLATSGVLGTPILSTSATASSPVAVLPYTITPSIGSLVATNYSFSFVNGTLTITPSPVTAAVTVSKVYDGNTTANFSTASGVLSGVYSGDTVTVNLAGATGAFADKNVGTGKPVSIAGVSLGGASVGNYSLAGATATGTISRAPLNAVSTVTKIYDGNTSVPALSGTNTTLTGVIAPDVVGLNFTNAVGAFANKNVGTGKVVTVTGLALSGNDAGNYSLTASGSGIITAKAAAASVTVSKVYDGTTSVPTFTSANATLTGIVPADVASLSLAGAVVSFADKNVGTNKAITVSGLTLTGADAGNYTLSISGSGTITKAPLTITADNKTMTAGGAVPTLTATFSGLVAGDTTNSVGAISLSTTATSASPAGTYPITITGGAGANYTTTLVNGTLTVNAGTVTPPKVVINTPAAGSTFSRIVGAPALSIPLTFTGTSQTTGGVITQLTASLNGVPLSVSSTTLNQRVATGAATMSVTNAGTYTIRVTATDAYGTAVATRTFTLVVTQGYSICGTVFFDVNFNGVFDGGGDCDDDDHWGDGYHGSTSGDQDDRDDCRGSRDDRYSDRGDCRDYGDRYYSREYDDDDEKGAEDFGLGGVTVKLYKVVNSTRQLITSTVTAADGKYCFPGLAAGSYIVSVVKPAGYSATTQTERSVSVTSRNVTVREVGFGLDFGQIGNHCADGKSDDYWYTQVDKCIRGESSGAQVSASTCVSHTKKIGALSLSLFDDISISTARSTLATTSRYTRDQLARQLIAAEYNYANGAYINGDKTLTYCFIQWGERVHKYSTVYSSSYAQWTTAWFKAYNESGGGRIEGPR